VARPRRLHQKAVNPTKKATKIKISGGNTVPLQKTPFVIIYIYIVPFSMGQNPAKRGGKSKEEKNPISLKEVVEVSVSTVLNS
jgi:hypothetical protein